MVTASQALTFNYTFTPTSSQADRDGFIAAGDRWSALFSDNVTINLDVGTGSLGAGILASAGSTRQNFTYTQFAAGLALDATTAADVSAVSSLQIGADFGMLLNRTSNNPNGSGSATPYLDDDGDANNTTVRLTTANAKAAGLLGATSTSDAMITFSNAFTYDYDSSDGITSGAFDYVGIATHEIGHALGFVSGVDVLDGNAPPINGPFGDDQFPFVSSLDLFRYSTTSTASGVIDWTADNRAKYFSLDSGVTSIASFSTGRNFGDGQQASHWKDNFGLGIMDPTFGTGELGTISGNDTLAFDAIGWDLIPEPSTGLLGIFGAALAISRRRR